MQRDDSKLEDKMEADNIILKKTGFYFWAINMSCNKVTI